VRFTSTDFLLHSEIIDMTCPLTMEVQLGTAIPKVARSQFGRVLSVRVANERCRSSVGRSSLAPLRAEEWALFYEGFSGTLPTITSVRLRLERVQLLKHIEAPLTGNTGCLIAGSVALLATIERGAIVRLTATREEGTRQALVRTLEGICDASDFLEGTFSASRAVSVGLL
jgi:hypothetical protein